MAPTISRCARCYLRHCVCAEIPRVETRTELVIVRHAAERTKPSNTARLATLALPHSTLLEYGAEEAVLDESQLVRGATWLLFPEGDRIPAGRPDRLIVLDGTWSQSRRMRRKISALRGLPMLHLVAPAQARLRLRRPLEPREMSTFEAIAAAVALLEGREHATSLERFFDRYVAAWLREATRII